MKYLEGSFSVHAPGTEAYRENHERTFGERKPGQRGRWIWDTEQQKMVRADEYVPPSHAIDGLIITDRWYEGAQTLSGIDIGSRRKRQEYMRANGLADANDVSQSYLDRQRADQNRDEKRARRQTVEDIYRRHRATSSVERLAPRATYDE